MCWECMVRMPTKRSRVRGHTMGEGVGGPYAHPMSTVAALCSGTPRSPRGHCGCSPCGPGIVFPTSLHPKGLNRSSRLFLWVLTGPTFDPQAGLGVAKSRQRNPALQTG